MSGPAVQFDGVRLTLGRTEILRGVDLNVEAGTVHALVGPNGGGKSSLIRALLGQVPHTGTIAFDWSGRAGVIGYVPQTLDFDRGLPMTVMDFMASLVTNRPAFRVPRADVREKVMRALERVAMADKAVRRMGALSGGELQRMLMAQGLMPEPDILILDEPMAALDEAGARIFESVIADLRSRGATIIWVEHDIAAVRRLADRVTGLNKEVLFDGTPKVELTPDRLLEMFSYHGTKAEAGLRRAS
jgi:zinc transport system ATP-binding protein